MPRQPYPPNPAPQPNPPHIPPSNGAKSKGPVTPTGKCSVSHNRMTHGFRANSIPLHTEDRAAYDAHLTAYLTRYTPTDKVEEDLVGLLASNMWQLMRNNSIEVALFDLEISGVKCELEGVFETMDEFGRLALAFKKSAGDNALELLRRYKSTTERAYHRALQALEQMQRDRQSQPKPENLSAVQTQAADDFTPSPPPNTNSDSAPTTTPRSKPAASASSHKPRLAAEPQPLCESEP